MREHLELPSPAIAWRPETSHPSGEQPVLLLAVPNADFNRYPCPSFSRVTAASTVEAIRLVQRDQPRCVVVDLDQDGVDGLAICRVAAGLTSSVILVTTGFPERVPAALKTGCDAVLLKPFTPNLLAARLGRLFRESATNNGDETVVERRGSNRVWPETSCPACRAEGATSFEFSSHRQMWYACLACDHVWLGPRQE